ncbi:hypothetical protein C0416_01565 [bacterium]|nr:hypothetical protein [bacterium]
MNTILHYLKTRALRQITQWLIIAACSIFILGTLAVADAYAQSSETYICKDLKGSTAGTCGIDEGCLDFNVADPPSDSFAAEICGPEEAFDGDTLRDFELQGWVWNTNLGYVSLYCDSTGKNNGVTCGSIPYGVKVNASTGIMSGWAWSDNIGWISFSCQGGSNQGYACGSINYETSIDLKVSDTLGKIKGYAWSDAVGWFDFQTGTASAQLLGLLMRESEEVTDWGVWTKAETEDGGMPPVKDLMPIAGSGDGYDIFVHVATLGGSPLKGGTYDLTITPLWKDSVGRNQTDSSVADHDTNNDGPVQKPTLVFDKDKITEEGVGNSHYGKVTSQMPTDGGNCYDGDEDGYCTEGGEGDFFYKNFGGVTAPENSLTYLGSRVEITIPATGDYWSTTVEPIDYNGGWKMDFLPQIDIPVFNYLMIPEDLGSALPFIQAIRNKADEFYVEGKKNLDVPHDITFELSSSDPNVEYVFVDSLTDEGNPEDKETRFTTTIDALMLAGNYLYGLPYATVEDPLQEFVPGAMIRSVVSIGGVGSYFNNGLPRGEDSNVQTQAAKIISGGVFSPGAKEAVEGSNVPLFGDIAVYQLRTQILSDISGLIRGVTLGTDNSPVVITNPIDLHKNTFKDNRLYYFENQDVTIEDINVLTAAASGKPVTVVVNGGDLYIENNVDISGQEFGFIVFESDTAVDGHASTKGGRIYVHSRVTDMVNVHIFADGPVFRYTDGICYFWGNYGPSSELVGLREPNFIKSDRCSVGSVGIFKEPLSALANQFYLKGNIASFNCLGCSTDTAPSRGDGLLLGGPSALNFAIARLYDLNYFSYYRQHPITKADSGYPSTNVAELKDAGKIDNEENAVYFEYSPAPTDLLGFRNF